MIDYNIAQAYVATILLFEVCSSIKLFGYLHGENLHLANEETNSCYTVAFGILYKPQ